MKEESRFHPSLCVRITALVLCALCAGTVLGGESERTPGALTWGSFSSENEFYTKGDLLVPLIRFENGLFFLNPRGTASDRSEQELNLGLGVRRLFETRYPFIVGAASYYDGRWTKHGNRFDQLGISLEVLSNRIDARANYYRPNKDRKLVDRIEVESVTQNRRVERVREAQWDDPYAQDHRILQDASFEETLHTITTRSLWKQTFERYEAAMEGYDAELGFRICPDSWPIEARVFGGYQDFDHPFEADYKGWKGRLELRALAGLLLFDAHWFENKDLNRGHYRIGARVSLPFDPAALAQGRNPFSLPDSATPRGLASRLGEMVMRDPKIQTSDSGYVEDPDQRTVHTQKQSQSVATSWDETVVVADNVIFVDADHPNADDANPGTFEQPKANLQATLDGLPGTNAQEATDNSLRQTIYVTAADQSYGSVTLHRPDVALIGSGFAWPCGGGALFGGGTAPVLDDPGQAVLITAPHAVLAGFDITTHGTGIGVTLESGRFSLVENHIHNNQIGVWAETLGDVDARIQRNLIENNAGTGFAFDAQGWGGAAPSTFFLDVIGNTFSSNDEHGFHLFATEYDNAGVRLAHNTASFNANHGIIVWLEVETDARIMALQNLAQANGDRTAAEPYGTGLFLQAQAGRDGWIRAEGNEVRQNAHGLWADAWAGRHSGVELIQNKAENNRWGLWANAAAPNVSARVFDNTATGHQLYGIQAWGMILDLAATESLSLKGERNILQDNDHGLRLTADAPPAAFGTFAFSGNNVLESAYVNLDYIGPAGTELDATYNWWGWDPPDPDRIVTSGAGIVNYTPWLGENPFSGDESADPGQAHGVYSSGSLIIVHTSLLESDFDGDYDFDAGGIIQIIDWDGLIWEGPLDFCICGFFCNCDLPRLVIAGNDDEE